MNSISISTIMSEAHTSPPPIGYQSLFDNPDWNVALIGADGRIKYQNPGMLKFFECGAQDLWNRFFDDFIHPEETRDIQVQLERLRLNDGDACSLERLFRSRSGRAKYGRIDARVIRNGGEGRSLIMISIVDITENKRVADEKKRMELELDRARRELDAMRRQLESQDGFLHSILESTTNTIATLDGDGRVTFVNQAAIDSLGRPSEEIIDKSFLSLLTEESVADFRAAFFSASCNLESISGLQMSIQHSDGQRRTLGLNMTPYRGGGRRERVVLVGGDITDRLSMRAQLAQAGKMATLGEMATGVAHEISQPLNVIRMAAEMIQEAGDGQDLAPDYRELVEGRAEKVVQMVDRGARIIRHLKAFGHQGAVEFGPLSLQGPIDQALELARDRLHSDGIVVNRYLDAGLGRIRGDAGALEQVFLNLILNSADAMKEQNEKFITLTAMQTGDDDRLCLLYSDNGPGIPDEFREKIFEPFFSTKESGKGTGLGMSISYGIIQSHNGTIGALPSGNGALFRIEFPVVEKE